jgi:hypothetical protein
MLQYEYRSVVILQELAAERRLCSGCRYAGSKKERAMAVRCLAAAVILGDACCLLPRWQPMHWYSDTGKVWFGGDEPSAIWR